MLWRRKTSEERGRGSLIRVVRHFYVEDRVTVRNVVLMKELQTTKVTVSRLESLM